MVLAYHNVVPSGTAARGDRSLHLSLEAFQSQLDILQASARIVPLSEVLDGSRDPERPTVAVTFDDAYRGSIEFGIRELVGRGLPATVFVAPGLLGASGFWWDRLADRDLKRHENLRHSALTDYAGMTERVMPLLGDQPSSSSLPAAFGAATLPELRAACDSSNHISLGAHSFSHPNLVALDDQALEAELRECRTWLLGSGLRSIDSLAYPYGLSDRRVQEAARRAGFSSAFAVSGGWLDGERDSRWSLPRFNVPAGLSADGFMLRIAGILSA